MTSDTKMIKKISLVFISVELCDYVISCCFCLYLLLAVTLKQQLSKKPPAYFLLQEADATFVTTNVILTANQTQGTCDEVQYSVVNPGFHGGGLSTPWVVGGRGAQPIGLANFPQKLHETLNKIRPKRCARPSCTTFWICQ